MILDAPIVCPKCGKSTTLVDVLLLNGKPVLQLCTLCAENPRLELILVEFRKLVVGVQHAVDRHCETCSGQGWRALAGGKRVSVRRERCRDCVGTGIDLRALLELWEIPEKPKPLRREPLEGFSPGQDLRRGRKP